MLKSKNNNGRLAIVDYDRCKPQKCNKECVMKCPPNLSGKKCITIGPINDIEDIKSLSVIIKDGSKEKKNQNNKAIIASNLCIGCGLCVKMCPFKAISIVNLPQELTIDKQLVSYGENSFRVYQSPHILKGKCIGYIGSNGLGKTTIIKVLSGETKLNIIDKKKLLGRSEVYGYLDAMNKGKLSISYKPQDISQYSKGIMGETKVSIMLEKISPQIIMSLDLEKLSSRKINQLSGGEVQRLLIGQCCSKDANTFLFDEPTAFLDIKQRIIMSNLISDKISNPETYVILIEHDLCIFDYISDYVVPLYGIKGAFGIIGSISNTFNGINNYLEGYLPTENIQFRDKPIKFKPIILDDDISDRTEYSYTACKYSPDKSSPDKISEKTFNLEIESGTFSTSEIVLLIGENGTGKSTMIKLLGQLLKTDGFNISANLSVSIKEQEVYSDNTNIVKDYLYKQIGNMLYNMDFIHMIIGPLGINQIFDLVICELSGGQMQRVQIACCLGKVADIYLLDEPSAFIDIEDRIQISKILRQFVTTNKKCMFLVEHDMIMATSTCDKVICFTGEPGINCKASAPTDIKQGINQFLKILGITMRRDKYGTTGRPRINKKDSQADREQKKSDQYFIME